MQTILREIRSMPNALELIKEAARKPEDRDLSSFLLERVTPDDTLVNQFLAIFSTRGLRDQDICEICAELMILISIDSCVNR